MAILGCQNHNRKYTKMINGYQRDRNSQWLGTGEAMIWAETGMCQRSPTNTFQRGLENGHKISKRLLLSQLFDSEKNGKATFLHRMYLQTHGSFNCFHNLAVVQTWGGTCHVEKEEAMYLIVFIHVFTITAYSIFTYCWWTKSCTALDKWNPVKNGLIHVSTGAAFRCISFINNLSQNMS